MTKAEIISALERGDRSNELDVQIEVALFEPDDVFVSARPNMAGTKVIYTHPDGLERTYWAPDWSKHFSGKALARLRKQQ